MAMTRFAILSFYLHSITLAPHHIRVVWSHGCGWPRARGLSPLIQACSAGGTRSWSCNAQRHPMICHHTKGMCCFLFVQQLMNMNKLLIFFSMDLKRYSLNFFFFYWKSAWFQTDSAVKCLSILRNNLKQNIYVEQTHMKNIQIYAIKIQCIWHIYMLKLQKFEWMGHVTFLSVSLSAVCPTSLLTHIQCSVFNLFQKMNTCSSIITFLS